jgi:hypothetical protein
MIQDGGFAAAQKTGEQRDGQAGISLGVHGVMVCRTGDYPVAACRYGASLVARTR